MLFVCEYVCLSPVARMCSWCANPSVNVPSDSLGRVHTFVLVVHVVEVAVHSERL